MLLMSFVLCVSHAGLILRYITTIYYQDPSMKITVIGWPSAGGKQMVINTPSRSSSDDQASS